MSRIDRFWDWYQRHFTINVTIASLLFFFQLFHLYWLFTEVVLERLTGTSYFGFDEVWGRFSILFDYTEIPALISVSLIYIHKLRQKFNYKSVVYLVFLNLQWLHILWITDEYVIDQFAQTNILHWATAFAWIAIVIDFLELPVIYDTAKETISRLLTKTQDDSKEKVRQ